MCVYVCVFMHACVHTCVHVNLDLKGKQGNEPESPFSIFIEKRMLKLNSNRQHPAFKTVALPCMCVCHACVCVYDTTSVQHCI